MLKPVNYIVVLSLCCLQYASGQNTIHNFGNLKIHEGAQFGIHINLVNDGIFDENKGLVGFYNTQYPLSISGALSPVFYDMEVAVDNGLYLNTTVGIENNNNFIFGLIHTPKVDLNIHQNYNMDAIYNSANNQAYIAGYASISNKSDFIFPIGDDNRLRSAHLQSTERNSFAQSAYFYENPNNPSTFNISFDTDNRTELLQSVSPYEFWDLNASSLSMVTLSWDEMSQIESFVENLNTITVVGWNLVRQQWEDLGNSGSSGDFSLGSITSDSFVPDNYAAITFGSTIRKELPTLGNFVLTPNADGYNDYLKLDLVNTSERNELLIFNRYGRKVYSQKNYENTFVGKANVKHVIGKKHNLPDGVYFYILELYDTRQKFQGYIYLKS